MTDKKLISVVTACYNEEDNVLELYNQVKNVFKKLPQYNYEHIFIDNSSKDNTVKILKEIANEDKNVKIIVNLKNFGALRSPIHALYQISGLAVIMIVADLQDPPYLIADFLKKWEEGYKIVIAVKEKSKENKLMLFVRKIFYNIISRISESEQVKNFTGYGLYDRQFIEIIKKIDDPYPYFRGMVTEFGFNRTEVPFIQPLRSKGKSKLSFYFLFDVAMLGFVNHSKLPLRLASFIGFSVAIINILVAIGYFIYKLLFWYTFNAGIAPLVIGIFFFGGVQLFFLGIIGEYIGAIFTQVKKRPLVIEKERINFEK